MMFLLVIISTGQAVSRSFIKMKDCYFNIACKILLPVFLIANSTLVHANNTEQIILVISKTGGVYQAFVEAFYKEYLEKTELGLRSEIKTISINDLSSNKKPWKYKNALVVTVGSKAAKFVAEFKLGFPVIHAMLPFSAYQKIENDKPACAIQSAIYIDQPIKRQIALSAIIFPDRKRYGFLLGSVSRQRYEIEKKIQGFPLNRVETRFIEESRELAWTLRDLSEDIDLLIALNDPLVFNPNNAKWLLYMAYQKDKPVIGFSKPYVSAGASAAVYSTPAQLGVQTAQQLVKHQQQKHECLFKPQYPRDFKVSINKAIVESLSGRELNEETIYEYIVRTEKAGK